MNETVTLTLWQLLLALFVFSAVSNIVGRVIERIFLRKDAHDHQR